MAGLMNPNGDPEIERTRPVPVVQEKALSADQRPASTVLEDDDEVSEPNVSDEEQAAYEAFVEAGRLLIYEGGKVNPGIKQMLDEDPADLIAILGEEVGENFSPVVALAATAVIVVLEVVRRAEDKPEGEIILHGGKELLEDLADMSGQTGGHTYTADELNDAMIYATNLYRETASAEGMIDQEALAEEFAEILNAQERGEIEQVLPGIGRYENEDR